MSERPDARQHPRFAVRIEAELRTPDGDRMAAITKDMSQGGICVICPRQVAAGSQIGLALSLVLGNNTFSEKLSVPGRVVWCTPVDKAFQVGVMFVGMDREISGHLEMFLRFLEQEVLVAGEPPPMPKTGPNTAFDTGDADKP
jgi:Tfp pilus assembly protein PilZ